MKNYLAIAALAIILLLAACSGGSTPTAAPTKAPAAATSAATPTQATAATAQPTQPPAAAASPTTPPKPASGTPAPKGVPLSGDIASDTVWTRANSPYIVSGSVNVLPGVTLTVEPGVEVRFAQQVGLMVNGKLSALGTATQPITFTANAATASRGWWNGVNVSGKDSTANLDYFTVQWAGFAQDGSLNATAGAVVNLNHGTVRDGAGSGIHTSQAGLANVSTSQITGNEKYPIEYGEGSLAPQLAALTIKGNGTDAIYFGHGIVSGQRVWKNLGVPYVMESQEVPAGATLTIEPGVEVRFSQQTTILVNGKLTALGTATLPITLTADSATPNRGWWNGIYVSGKNATANLDYVTVQWAGFAQDGSLEATADGVISLNHGAVRNGNTSGIHASQVGVVHVANSQITGNAKYALEYNDGSVVPQLSGLTIKGNGTDAIYLGHGIVSGQRAWKNLGVPYVMDNQEVPAGATLTVEPGVVVSFSQQTGILVNGKLVVQGTAAQPVVFTADTSTPNRGYWNGIYASGNQASVALQYTTVRWAGFALSGAVDLQGIASANLSFCTLRDSRVSGLYVASNGKSVTVANSQILDNDGLGIENADPASPVNAANNWWGAASGPTAGDNPGGAGSEVSEGVTYKPFLTSAPKP